MRAAPELSTTYAPTFALPPSVVTNAARTTVVRTPIGRASGDAAPVHADHAYQLNTATSGSWSNEQAPSRGGARPGRGAGTSVGRCRWRRMRSITEASSISAISRKRPPSFDRAQDGPEQRRRATARTGQNVDPAAFAQALRRASPKPWRRRERPAHQVRPAPCLLAGPSPLAPAGWIGRGFGGSGVAGIDVLSGCGCVGGADLAKVGALCGPERVGSARFAAAGGVSESHDERPPRRPWSQDAMIQNEVDARPRDQDGQPLY